ncbi:MAG TPA: hypothetical protein VF939_23620 [Puia sp.]
MFSKETLTTEKQKVDTTKNLPDFENDPAFIRAKERAIKILTESPLPDVILKRIEGPSFLKQTS